jgi:protein-export membrane protein SecD
MLLRFAPWKLGLIFLILLAGSFFAAPNVLTPAQRGVTATDANGWYPSSPLKLGLDLRGGASILLEIDPNDLRTNRLRELMRDVRQELGRTPRIPVSPQNREIGATNLLIRPNVPTETEAAVERIRKLGQSANGQIGAPNLLRVDARADGWIEVTLTAEAIERLQRDAIAASIEAVRRRVDATGTVEPTIQQQGENRILVEVPGLADPKPLIDVLTQAGVLTFQLVDTAADPGSYTVGVPRNGRILLESMEGAPQVLEEEFIVSGSDLQTASQIFDEYNRPAISFTLRPAGAQRFGKVTTENIDRPFAIVLDDRIVSAPTIQSPITGGTGRITGSFTIQEAENLAIILRSGALPAKLKVVEQRLVGPELGRDSIEKGVTASVAGLALVAVFMIFYYGLFGVFAVFSLAINIVLIVGVMSAFGSTMTLPGIAGILLTMGMAVDANVLVFERIKEEKRAGRSPVSSIETGYSQAMATIVDSNLTTLIASLILFIGGRGPVKGFGLTLTIGILTSMFTAIIVSRLLVATWVRLAKPKSVPI